MNVVWLTVERLALGKSVSFDLYRSNLCHGASCLVPDGQWVAAGKRDEWEAGWDSSDVASLPHSQVCLG